MGNMLSFYHCKNHKAGHILHTRFFLYKANGKVKEVTADSWEASYWSQLLLLISAHANLSARFGLEHIYK